MPFRFSLTWGCIFLLTWMPNRGNKREELLLPVSWRRTRHDGTFSVDTVSDKTKSNMMCMFPQGLHWLNIMCAWHHNTSIMKAAVADTHKVDELFNLTQTHTNSNLKSIHAWIHTKIPKNKPDKPILYIAGSHFGYRIKKIPPSLLISGVHS